MNSIRWYLTCILAVTIGALLVATGLTIFFSARYLLLARFDETLATKAQALIIASEIEGGKKKPAEFEIDLTVREFAGFGYGGDDFFEVIHPDGRVLARSPSLRKLESESPHHSFASPEILSTRQGRTYPGLLPDGRPARVHTESFNPRKIKDRSEWSNLILVVASPSDELRRQLGLLTGVLTTTGLGALVLLIPLIRLGLKRGLRPLDQLASRVAEIRADQLDKRLPAATLPAELRPVAEQLNAWLARLEASFERERRFTADAAHELRTPLAEIKSLAELGAKWPEEATPSHSAEIAAAATELQALLEKLALLARAQSPAYSPVPFDPIATSRLILAPLTATAHARGHKLEILIHPDPVYADSELWSTILRNLTSNAIHHAPPASRIEIETGSTFIRVVNPAPDLSADDLPHLFERFWCKDRARQDRQHSGLGLSIVKSCVQAMNGDCQATMTSTQILQIRAQWPAKAPPHSSAT